MRTFTLASCLAVSQAIKLMDFGGTTFNMLFEDLKSTFDADGDGVLDPVEYIKLLEFLDEDQSLNARELGEAITMWNEMSWAGDNPTDHDLSMWLTEIVSSSAQDGDDFDDDRLDLAHFITLATKLGVSETEARELFATHDENGDGILSISQQYDIWNSWISAGTQFTANDDFVAPDGSVPDDGEPDDGTPDDGTPDDGEPDDGTPDDGEPDDGTPDDGTPDDGTPDDGTPDDGEPDDGEPDDGEPDDGEPDDGEPDDGEPDDGEPDDGTPDDGCDGDDWSQDELDLLAGIRSDAEDILTGAQEVRDSEWWASMAM